MRYSDKQININFGKEIYTDREITCGEFFAGGGGWTSGIEGVSGIKTKWILNHDKVALRTNSYHHKGVKVYWADIYTQDEHELEYVDHVHGSIECKHHSDANNGKPKKLGSYTMGWEFYRYLKYLLPLVISIENVPEFKKWAPVDETGYPIKERTGEEFERWKKAIMDLGYLYKESIRNAADDGMPTSRERYFGFFYKDGIDITFPEATHSKKGDNGKLKWEGCGQHIDLNNHGLSIFGRKFNTHLSKTQQKPFCHSSLKRIGGGVRKLYPEFTQFITNYYGGENQNRFQSLLSPINTIPTENRHQLVTIEKLKFILDYLIDCENVNYKTVNLQNDENSFFLAQYYGNFQVQAINEPINTIVCRDLHQLVRLEKMQFIAKYYNSNGNPEHNVQSLDIPISPILTEPKHQLITLLDDFDIKTRFLNAEELGRLSTFPEGYFTNDDLKLSHKDAIRMIGNAVPPMWATILMGHNVDSILNFKTKRLSA